MDAVEIEKPSSVDVAALQRSKIHILLSDRDGASRQHVLELLRHCSYKGMLWCISYRRFHQFY